MRAFTRSDKHAIVATTEDIRISIASPRQVAVTIEVPPGVQIIREDLFDPVKVDQDLGRRPGE